MAKNYNSSHDSMNICDTFREIGANYTLKNTLHQKSVFIACLLENGIRMLIIHAREYEY